MKLVILDEKDERMGEASLEGTIWRLEGNTFSNVRNITVTAAVSGLPKALETRRPDGSLYIRTGFATEQEHCEPKDRIRFAPGKLKFDMTKS